MSGALYRIWQTALWEWHCAIRSRRALMVMLLYLASAVLCMNGAITILGKMEQQLIEILQLPSTGITGTVSQTLWKSKHFTNIVTALVGKGPVLDGIFGRHPVELLYAWFAFLCAPLLSVLVSGTRVSDDLRSGALRYMLVRTTRLEWTFGKFIGQVLMVGVALSVSSLGAVAVAFFLLTPATAASLAAPMLLWGVRAWVFSWAWIGLALGLSHMTRSSGRATSLGILGVFSFTVFPPLLRFFHGRWAWPDWVLQLQMFVPSAAEASLWRFDVLPVALGSFHLLLLGLVYLMAGSAVFMRRDV